MQIADGARRAVEQAMAQGGAVVAAGGDGTINAVAQEAHDAGCPMGVLPQGTFNYFSRTHGIPTETTEAIRALMSSRVEPVQVGLVNENVFLVNASLGLYPALLEDREQFKQRFHQSPGREGARHRDSAVAAAACGRGDRVIARREVIGAAAPCWRHPGPLRSDRLPDGGPRAERGLVEERLPFATARARRRPASPGWSGWSAAWGVGVGCGWGETYMEMDGWRSPSPRSPYGGGVRHPQRPAAERQSRRVGWRLLQRNGSRSCGSERHTRRIVHAQSGQSSSTRSRCATGLRASSWRCRSLRATPTIVHARSELSWPARRCECAGSRRGDTCAIGRDDKVTWTATAMPRSKLGWCGCAAACKASATAMPVCSRHARSA